MNRYQEIEINGKQLLSVEVLSKIRKGEDMLGIDQVNLSAMSADELAAYLKELRRNWEQNTTGETPDEPAETVEAEWAKGLDFGESSQITKLADELSEAERQRIAGMGIDIADADYVTLTKHVFAVATGGNQWQQKRLGTKPVIEDEMRKLKTDYNRLLAELRGVKDTQAAKALWKELDSTYEAIVRGGDAISYVEASKGFEEIEKF